MTQMQSAADLAFLKGRGETGALMRRHDWSASTLGQPQDWPEALKVLVSLVLGSDQPIFVLWGPDSSILYNDGYARILRDRHPQALAKPFIDVWRDIADKVAPFLERASRGEPSSMEKLRLPVTAPDKPHGIYLSYSSTPIRDENGIVRGLFCTCADTTERVLADERATFMTELSERLRSIDHPRAVMAAAAEMLGRHFGVGRCGYGEIDASDRYFTVEQDWTDGIMPSIAGRVEIAGFGAEVIAAHRAGQAVRMDDQLADQRAQGSHAAYAAIGVRAGIGVPLVRDGRLQALFYVHDSAPRKWSDADEMLVRQVAERTWNAVREARAEAALRKSENRFRALVNASSYMVYTASADWREIREVEGAPPAPAAGLASWQWRDRLVPAEDRPMLDAAMATATRTKSILDIEHRVMRQDGSWGWIRSCSIPLLDEHGEIVEWFGAASDISERRQAEEKLREREEQLRITSAQLRAVLDAAPIAVWFTADREAQRWRRNRKAAEWVGAPANPDFSSAEWQEMSAATRVERAGEIIEADDYPLSRAARGIETRNDIIRMTSPDGTVRDLLCNAVPLRDPSGEISGAVCTGTDITAQLATERRLRELTQALETQVSAAEAERKVLADVVEAMDALVQVIDTDFRWLAINNAAIDTYEQLLGVRPKPGDSLLELLTPFPDRRRQLEGLWRRALTGEEFTTETTIGMAPTRHLEMKFSPLVNQQGELIGAYQFVNDITERVESNARLVEAQTQLHEMQKLDMIGQLTGNVAHDFNNLLTPIVGTLDLLSRRAADARDQRLTSGALQAADKARTLVQRLLAFARRQHLQARSVAVAGLINSLMDLMARSVGSGIRLETHIASGLPTAHVDPNQLELALLNLAVNARDAMPDGGTLTITADLDSVVAHPKLGTGNYIRISVVDCGIGMDDETLRRAVEPFFTTKPAERGTGLGLSMVHGLAAQSGGDFALSSKVGKGTTATIWLPMAGDADIQQDADHGDVQPVEGRSETVLLVDDEPLVRGATAGMLQDAGFTVVEADSPSRALELARGGLAFDALVTDYAMPGMSGARLARQLREVVPNLPVLLITGYAAVEDVEAAGLPRLGKPFRQPELAARMATLLDRRGLD